MHILLFILLFIITIIVFGLSVVGLILKAIFGIGHRFSSSSRPRQNESGRSADQQSYSQGTHRPTDHELKNNDKLYTARLLITTPSIAIYVLPQKSFS